MSQTQRSSVNPTATASVKRQKSPFRKFIDSFDSYKLRTLKTDSNKLDEFSELLKSNRKPIDRLFEIARQVVTDLTVHRLQKIVIALGRADETGAKALDALRSIYHDDIQGTLQGTISKFFQDIHAELGPNPKRKNPGRIDNPRGTGSMLAEFRLEQNSFLESLVAS